MNAATAAAPKPPTPLELRDGMIEDYAANVRKHGGTVDIAAVERVVQNDLSIYEQVSAVAKERRASGKAPEFNLDEREDTAAINAKDKGMDLYRRALGGDEPARPKSLLEKSPHQVSAKFPAMMGRIKRICEPRGVAKPGSLTASIAEMAVPKLAREFINLYLCYSQPAIPTKSNPFREVANPRDRARMFLRMVEDICDRSTGIPGLGPWWVR